MPHKRLHRLNNPRLAITSGLLLLFLVVIIVAINVLPQFRNQADEAQNSFEDLGIPVTTAGFASYTIGPNQNDTKDLVYMDFSQIGDGNSFFMLAVDPDTGKTQQYKAPLAGNFNAQTIILGADKRLYMVSGGTSGTPFSGHFVVFDPKQPKKGIQDLGKIPGLPDKGTTVWDLTNGTDGKIYGASGPDAALVSYDTATGKMEHLGRMGSAADSTIIRVITTGTNGKIYMGLGYNRSDVVVYDPATKSQKSILPDNKKLVGARGHVFRAVDGNIYFANTSAEQNQQWYKVNYATDSVTPIASPLIPKAPGKVLRDGRQVIASSIGVGQNSGYIQVWDPVKRNYTKVTYAYQSDGSAIFSLGKGPDNYLYGGSIIPLLMFKTNPSSDKTTVLGNPSESSGEIYSFLNHSSKLYIAAYSHANFSVYDPARPFDFGKEPTNNPRSFGTLDTTQDRPKTMIAGPGDKIYIGTAPSQGNPSGALLVFDPTSNVVTERYYGNSLGLGNVSIDSLAYDRERNIVYGSAGPRLFGWDANQKKIILNVELMGSSQAQAMTIAKDKLFIATLGKNNPVFTFDLVTRQITKAQPLQYGYTRAQGLDVHPNGYVYGVTGYGIVYRIDPTTSTIIGLGQYKDYKRGYGAVILSDGLYFGNSTHLIRYRLSGRPADPDAISDPSITPVPDEVDDQDSIDSTPAEPTTPQISSPEEPLPAGVTAATSTLQQKDKEATSNSTKKSVQKSTEKPKTQATTKNESSQAIAANDTAAKTHKLSLYDLIVEIYAATDKQVAAHSSCGKLNTDASLFARICHTSRFTGIWIIEAAKALVAQAQLTIVTER